MLRHCVVFLTTLVVCVMSALPPCDQLLSQVQSRPGAWSATLSVIVPDQPNAAAFGGWHLRLTFTEPVDTLKHNGAGVTMSTVDDRNFILRLNKGDPGRKVVLQLTAQHAASENKMGLSLVKYNNMAVCKSLVLELEAAPVPKFRTCPELLDDIIAHTRPGEWTATLRITVPEQPNAAAFKGWHLKLVFNQPIRQLAHNVTGASTSTVDDRNFIMRSPRGNATLSPGDKLVIKLYVQYDEKHIIMLSAVTYNNMLVCNGTRNYDYGEALSLTLLFLEAQQSGALPGDQRIPWRGDSCMNDRGKSGEDLTGGYFTGSVGRTVKFTFPNAATNTILAWGMIVYEAAYEKAGELVNGMAAVDWGARYLSRCYTPSQEVYAIMGDHMREPKDFWCRPEDINYARPSLALSPENPGSDLFGEVVAALAASSVVLKNHWEGPHIAAGYLAQARRLFEMAVENRGDYLRAMQLLTWDPVYTPRNGDECELIWAATWMYRATSEPRYLQLAQRFYKKLNFRKRPFTFFYWDDKAVGAMILLYQITKNEEYAIDARIFCDTITQNSSLHTASGVLRGIGNFASGLQLGAWASFACVELGETLVRYGAAKSNPYIDFALLHIHYILGDTGRSFLVGYGQNYPLRPKHIASVCGPPPATCDRVLFESDQPNYHTLHGAFVFGPDMEGQYMDSRLGVHNNVDIVSNAGLSSALAALWDLRKQGKIS